MQRDITYWFSLLSPWSYLGHARLMDMAGRHDVRVIWRPIDLMTLFDASGGLPLARRHPNRRAYRDIELQRWRDTLGMPLNLKPTFWPVDIGHADRLVLAIAALGQDPDPFVQAGFAAVWARDRDLANATTLAELLEETGFAPDLLEAARADDMKAAYARNTRDALEAGVFGAPTYGIDGELFWGQDRLPLLDAMLARGRPAYRA